MKNEFVPYEIAKELKELGFDEPCICGYSPDKKLRGKLASTNNSTGDRVKIDWDKQDSHLPAPLWQQVFLWFVENHQLNGAPTYNISGKWDYDIQRVESGLLSGQSTWYKSGKDTYNEIQLECIKRLIERVKEKNERKV